MLALVCSSSAALAVVREGEMDEHKVRGVVAGTGWGAGKTVDPESETLNPKP